MSRSIVITNYEWKKSLIVAGHYEFIIKITDEEGVERTITRRFSHIEKLQEGLIKYDPGCFIPAIPEKSIWYNICVSNQSKAESRKQALEKYLNYIYNHKYLSENPVFKKFLSDDFPIKGKGEDTQEIQAGNPSENPGVVNKVIGLASKSMSYFGIFQGKSDKISASYVRKFGEGDYDSENEMFCRLSKGLSDILATMKKNIEINESKNISLNKFVQIAKGLRLSLDDDEIQESEREDRKKKEDKLKRELSILEKSCGQNNIYKNKLEPICNKIEEYYRYVNGILEIFARKRQHAEEFQKMMESNDEQLNAKKELIEKLNEEFKYELEEFHKNKEDTFNKIILEFYDSKLENAKNVKIIFDSTYDVNEEEIF